MTDPMQSSAGPFERDQGAGEQGAGDQGAGDQGAGEPSAVDPIASWPIGRLLSTAARLVEHAWAQALEERGLTHAGLIVLHLLDSGALGQTELARRARVETQTMSRTVDRLEKSGYVVRAADPIDRRRQRIARTAEGDAALEATRALEAEVFPAVGDPELVRYSLLEIIHAASRDRWTKDADSLALPPIVGS